MEKLIEFYRELSDKRKIVFWVCLFFIFISFGRILVSRRNVYRSPRQREILQQLASDDITVKKFAIYTAGARKMDAAIPILIKMLEDEPDHEIKKNVTDSIGKIDQTKLIGLLDSEQKETKSILMNALIKLDPDNFAYLLQRFPHENTDTKLEILSFINSANFNDYTDKIIRIAEDTNEDVTIRMKSLQIIGTQAILEDVESRLWNLYYNDPIDEIKKLSYTVITELRKSQRR